MIGGEFSDGGRGKQNMRRARKAQSVVVARATESGHPVVMRETFSLVATAMQIVGFYPSSFMHRPSIGRDACVISHRFFAEGLISIFLFLFLGRNPALIILDYQNRKPVNHLNKFILAQQKGFASVVELFTTYQCPMPYAHTRVQLLACIAFPSIPATKRHK